MQLRTMTDRGGAGLRGDAGVMARRLAWPAIGAGLLGGLLLAVLMVLYVGSQGLGYASPFNVSVAAWVFPIRPPAAMLPALAKVMGPVAAGHPALLHAMMALKTGHATNAAVATLMGHMPLSVRAMVLSQMPVSAAHVVVGVVLHFAFAVAVGLVFATVLALLAWLRVPAVSRPLGLVVASVLGGGLLFVIMYYGILPALNPIMANAPTAAFLGAHLAYGLGVGVVMAWALFRRPGVLRGHPAAGDGRAR